MDTPEYLFSPAPEKFRNPHLTAKGEVRAAVSLRALKTLWFNTGSLCNITCDNCFMESSPTNDRLAYLRECEVQSYLDELSAGDWAVEEIGFTGGEPFMNPDIMAMLRSALGQGYRVLVLSNGMKPMHHKRQDLLHLKQVFGDALAIRISVDHHTISGHEEVRGANTWGPMIDGLQWLSHHGFNVTVAGRMLWDEDIAEARRGYARAFCDAGISSALAGEDRLVLFPEMDRRLDVPEITEACWGILGVNPDQMMCASSRMVIKRKGSAQPVVTPCTLLPYDPAFEMGPTLKGAKKPVKLNHPHCAQFCVLGGASCSG